MNGSTLLQSTAAGLYCPGGDFHIDPWLPVPRAVITHAHSDHLRWGCGHYLVAAEGLAVTRARLEPDASVQAVPYGEAVRFGGVQVSLHPAGHILGSAQVRVEERGEVWVVSGDYKREPSPTCAPFEPLRAHTFVTESTFGLPIFRWEPEREVFDAINAWWRANAAVGRASLLYGYALGKAQRLLAGVDAGIGPIYTHGAVERLNEVYRAEGITLPDTVPVSTMPARAGVWGGALIVAPPSAHGSPWTRRFGEASTAFASGWMRIRGTRRRRAVDRGFVLSDHADWPGLLETIAETGAERVWVTHGYSATLAQLLRERGLDAAAIATQAAGEQDDMVEAIAQSEGSDAGAAAG
jgi:putative mRNA 3-end processing factor